MTTRSKGTPGVTSPQPALPTPQNPPPAGRLTWPEAMVFVVIVVDASVMAEVGMTTHAILSLLGGAVLIGAAAVASTTTRAVGRAVGLLRRVLAAAD